MTQGHPIAPPTDPDRGIVGKDNDMEILSSDDRRRLQEHQRIRDGGAKLLTMVFIHSFFSSMFGGIVMIMLGGVTPSEVGSVTFNYQLAIAIIITVTINIWLSHFGGYRSWLANYWRKNFIGWVAQFSVISRDAGDGRFVEALRLEIKTRAADRLDWIHARTRTSDPVPDYPFTLSIPLGGWFAGRAQIITRYAQVHRRLTNWSGRLLAVFDNNHVMLSLRYRGGMWRRHPEQIVCSLDQAFEYLNQVSDADGAVIGLSGLLSGSFRKSRWEEVGRKMAALDRDLWRTRYIDQLIKTIDELDATKRFIRSKQAQAIREHLVVELLTWIADDDPRRPRYAAVAPAA